MPVNRWFISMCSQIIQWTMSNCQIFGVSAGQFSQPVALTNKKGYNA
jgi:hypothetical protein